MDTALKDVLDWLDARKPSTRPAADDAEWLAAFRAQTALIGQLSGEPIPLHAVDHRIVGGTPVRFYRAAAGDRPVVLHLHGGGAIAGSLDGHDPALRLLAARTGWTVAAPAYRLAPEARFPAQLDDALAVLSAIEAPVIVVSGDSIGATLATSLAHAAPGRLAGQVLFYPNTDLRRGASYPSRRSEDGIIIDATSLERQIDLYLADPAQRNSPKASPIINDDLASMPPTFVATAAHDPLRDEGEDYVARLRGAGVSVEHHRAAGAPHAFLQMAARLPAAAQMLDRLRAWLGALPR